MEKIKILVILNNADYFLYSSDNCKAAVFDL